MTIRDKAGRSRVLLVQRAAGEFEQTAAGPALKVVVMLFPGSLVKRSKGGLVDLSEPSLCHQQFEITIDSRLIEGPYRPAPGIQDFFNAQGPVVLPEDLLDRMPLARPALR